jgi:hypothetical protein
VGLEGACRVEEASSSSSSRSGTLLQIMDRTPCTAYQSRSMGAMARMQQQGVSGTA